MHHNVIPHTCIISAFLLTNVARAGDEAQLLRARARSDDDPGDQMMQPAIYCWLRAPPPMASPGIWVNQSWPPIPGPHNRMVIIRGVITCEPQPGITILWKRGCVLKTEIAFTKLS